MLKNLFRKTAKASANRPKIQLGLTFLGFEADGQGVMIGWRAIGAPPDIIFDIDFLGRPSNVTTGFVWDGEQSVLRNVFAIHGDTSFQIKAGWAYSGNATDGSGNVEAVWVVSAPLGPELKFEHDREVTVDFVFDPKQTKVRIP